MKIAITGTIGSGKTTVCDFIRSKGFDVFSCDKVNSKLLEKGKEGYKLIKQYFPECFINDELDKKAISSIVFNDKNKKELLESLLHPLILNKMLNESNKNEIFFAEVPLLFETGQDKYFDYKWLVVNDEEIAINRLINRGLDKQDAINRIRSQMPIEIKKNKSDEIIYNNRDLNELSKKVDELLKKYAG